MTDIVLSDVKGGYNRSSINSNFEKIEEVVNTELLHLEGGNNIMKQDIDLDSNSLLNVNLVAVQELTVRGTSFDEAVQAIADEAQVSADASEASAVASEASSVQSGTSASESAASAVLSANSEAASQASLDTFQDIQWGPYASEPALSPVGNPATTGDQYFNTTLSLMLVYNGAVWQEAASSINGIRQEYNYTGALGQAVFAAIYDIGFVDVHLNGVKLIQGDDYTALTGTDIALTTPLLVATDTVNITAYSHVSFENGSNIPVIATGTTETRTLGDRFAGVVNVKDFGAVGDGVTDDTTAISIADASGNIHFTAGEYRLTTYEFLGAITFDEGAKLLVDAGSTVTIRSNVYAGEHFCLGGAGSYDIGNDSVKGEYSRKVKASWFGVFPVPTYVEDHGVLISSIFSYLGNSRESIVEFQMGNYHLDTGVLVTRGGWVKGDGQRRTVFKMRADGFDAFKTDNIACRFSGIQFELEQSLITDRLNGAHINILHDHCDIYEVSTTTSTKAIVINDNDCRVRNVLCTSNANTVAGGSIVEVNGNLVSVEGVEMSGVTGPESIVNIGGGAGGTISGITVKDIRYYSDSIGVTCGAIGGNITRVSIADVMCNSFSGNKPDHVVHVKTTGSRSMDFIHIDNVISPSFPLNCITLEQASSSSMKKVLINNVSVNAITGHGLGLIESSGTLEDIYVGMCNFNVAATPIFRSGSPSLVRIDPISDGRNPTASYDLGNVADDTVVQIDLHRGVVSSTITLNAGSTNYGLFSARIASSPSVVSIVKSTNVNAVNTALTGTTGVDGDITLGVTDAVLYVENRSGNSQRISVEVSTGII